VSILSRDLVAIDPAGLCAAPGLTPVRRALAVGGPAYPYPSHESTGVVTSNALTWTIAYPSGIEVGDLLVLNVAVAGNKTLTADGLSPIFTINNGTAVSGHTLVGIVTGTEGPTVDLILSGADQGAWRMAHFPHGTWYGSLPGVVGSSGATGNDDLPDPDDLTPGWSDDTYWRAICALADGRDVIDGYPTGFSIAPFADASGGTGGAAMASAGRQSMATSEDAGAFHSPRSDKWVAWTVALRAVPLDLSYLTTDGSADAALYLKAS
jgi:hypothetical protein